LNRWLIAGLGNPGRNYELTRHNAGFLAVELLARRHGVKLNKLKFEGLCGEWREQDALLILPQTFMNESGRCLRRAMDYYKIPAERVLAVFDDASLPPGRLRVRRDGSDGGHNGVKSLLYHLGGGSVPRINIGVGEKPRPEMDLADWVLGIPSPADQKWIGAALDLAADAAETILTQGIEKAMNDFNAPCAN
jgi:PTH1 family peptidyl-tRNA hydrolase